MRLEFSEGTSNKFWEAAVEGKTLVVRWGRIGSTGQEKRFDFKTVTEASAELSAQSAKKLEKGYRRVDVVAGPARAPKLEAAMFAAPDEASRALVYADWLQANGNSWGELITVQHELAGKPKDKELKAREKKLLGQLPIPHSDFATVTWRRGVIDSIHVFNERDWMDETHEVIPLVQPLFELPMCGALRELRTGVIRWDSNTIDVPAVLACAAEQPFAKRLQRLFLGDIDRNVDMDHHVIGDVRAISKQFPGLVALKLHSGSATWSGKRNFEFGPLSLPKLESLVIETCGLSKGRLEQLMTSVLPSLRELELWFGDPDQDGTATATPKQLAPLFEAKLFPKLETLGLKNTIHSNEIAQQLAASPLAGRLKVIDLSMGVLDSKGAAALASSAQRFSKLERLDVSDSFLVPADRELLAAAFPKVTLVFDDQKDVEGDDPDWRYVTVSE